MFGLKQNMKSDAAMRVRLNLLVSQFKKKLISLAAGSAVVTSLWSYLGIVSSAVEILTLKIKQMDILSKKSR